MGGLNKAFPWHIFQAGRILACIFHPTKANYQNSLLNLKNNENEKNDRIMRNAVFGYDHSSSAETIR